MHLCCISIMYLDKITSSQLCRYMKSKSLQSAQQLSYLVLFSFSLCVCLRLCIHACCAMAAPHMDRRDDYYSSSSSDQAEDYHGSNTIFLVGTLMSVVGGVFIVFATMALCYRSVVVHKNFSLCLRLVSRPTKVAIHVYTFIFSASASKILYDKRFYICAIITGSNPYLKK